MKKNNLKIKRYAGVVFLIILLGISISCSKDDEEPIYLGKWILEETVPPLDISYFTSYIHIKLDKSFELYDGSKDLLVYGQSEHFLLKGTKLTLTDPETDIKYLFSILSRKQDILKLRTSIFGPNTELTMRKVSD